MYIVYDYLDGSITIYQGKKNMSTEKKSMMDKILEKVDVIAGPMTKFGQIPFVRGIVNGMVAALPVTMVGSLFLVVYLFCSDGGLTTHALIPFLLSLIHI